MQPQDLVRMLFTRMWDVADGALEGLTDADLKVQPKPDCNPIGWIAWHNARVEDRWTHLLTDKSKEVWRRGWAERMGLGHLLDSSGGGMPIDEVVNFKTPPLKQLRDYMTEVRADTSAYIDTLTPQEFDREIETWFGRRMTIGQVFSHITCEMNQHIGQLAYLKGYVKGFQGSVGPAGGRR